MFSWFALQLATCPFVVLLKAHHACVLATTAFRAILRFCRALRVVANSVKPDEVICLMPGLVLLA